MHSFIQWNPNLVVENAANQFHTLVRVDISTRYLRSFIHFFFFFEFIDSLKIKYIKCTVATIVHKNFEQLFILSQAIGACRCQKIISKLI